MLVPELALRIQTPVENGPLPVGRPVGERAAEESSTAASGAQGYRESAHVLRYYQTARV